MAQRAQSNFGINNVIKKYILIVTVVLAGVMSSGCASNNPDDPLEPFNRAMFSFNEGVDKAILRPVASGYKAVTPEFARRSVSNFFSNAGLPWSTVNAGLQLKAEKFLTGVFRFGVNTIFGFGGLLDIASEMGLDHPQEDFGQTLGYWGVKPGPYLVLPILGPSNIRDTVGMTADFFGNPLTYIDDDGTRYGLTALNGINLRAQLIGADDVVEGAALDKYIFMRDGYMQRRQNLVYDGNPPSDPSFDIDDDDL